MKTQTNAQAHRARRNADSGLHWQSAAATALFNRESATENSGTLRFPTQAKVAQFQHHRTSAVRLFCLIAIALLANIGDAQQANRFPAHWGEPPAIQTRDMVELPGGYGRGSSTLKKWIATNLEKDKHGGESKPSAKAKPLFECNFEQAEPGKLPEEFKHEVGTFTAKAEGTNKFLELPGAPVDSYSVQFGSVETADVVVSARILGTMKGRRGPTFGVGLGGISGFKMQVAPGKKALELLKDQDIKATAAFDWKAGEWTNLRLQIRKLKDGQWKIEGKAWPYGSTEPKDWMLSLDESEEPMAGLALLMGSPLSGTPIGFDDLVMERTSAK